MNPFQRARNEAHAVRKILAPGRSLTPISAPELLSQVEDNINIAIEQVGKNYPDLGGGSAVLQRSQGFIYISCEIPEWSDAFCGLVAHELGHWYLDPDETSTTIADLNSLLASQGSTGVMTVEAYGARERQELQANVFARELLLPRSVARNLAQLKQPPKEIANSLGIPLEFVRQQMLDAILLPETKDPLPKLHQSSTDQLNAAQTGGRAANVIAGPGTGKTTTLIHRVKHLIQDKKVHPSQILVLTFTNKAALELIERLKHTGITQASNIWAGTFHAFGLEFLRKYHQKFNLDAEVNVADKLSAMMLISGNLSRIDLSYHLRVEDPFDWLDSTLSAISRLKEELISPADYLKFVTRNPESDDELQRKRLDVAKVFELYENLLLEHKTVDFVDLIGRPTKGLKTEPYDFKELTDRFSHILVDEYQDVTQVMIEFVRQFGRQKTIWVVGDIRQAIHHWRGASLKSLLKFESEFNNHAGSSQIQCHSLNHNRRSTQEIVNFTQHIGRQHILESQFPLCATTAANGYSGELPTVVTCNKRSMLLSSIRENIISLVQQGVHYGYQAVLYRTASDVKTAAAQLEQSGIPIVFIGELIERAEVKQLLCLMQLLVERHPKALIGLTCIESLKMPDRDITYLLKITADNTEYQRGRWIKNTPGELSDQGNDVVNKLRKILSNHNRRSSPWEFICDLLLEHGIGLPLPSDNSVKAWVQRIALWQLAYAVRGNDNGARGARLSRFLLRQRLRQRIGETLGQRELPPEASILNGVHLTTVHGSKGLEYDAVHIGNIKANHYGSAKPTWQAEGILDIVPPAAINSSQDEYDFESAVERNNLLYVAVSRAKRHLFLYQECEWGQQEITPQLQHTSEYYNSKLYTGHPVKTSHQAITNKHQLTEVEFTHFDTYTMCPLQYYYRYIKCLRNEADIDISLKARSVVMKALKSFVLNPSISAYDYLLDYWNKNDLPDSTVDEFLWRDSQNALSRGISLVNSLQSRGGVFYEPSSSLANIAINMPWGLLIQHNHSTEFAMIRFSRRRTKDIQTILRPIITGLEFTGHKKISLNYILSDKTDECQASKRIDSTKAYKAAIKLEQGDSTPQQGRHCSRCNYSTICPNVPEEEA